MVRSLWIGGAFRRKPSFMSETLGVRLNLKLVVQSVSNNEGSEKPVRFQLLHLPRESHIRTY